jgi:hypothetical protein
VESKLRRGTKMKPYDERLFIQPINSDTWLIEASDFQQQAPIKISLQLNGANEDVSAALRRL